jgi:hypothetical protein
MRDVRQPGIPERADAAIERRGRDVLQVDHPWWL